MRLRIKNDSGHPLEYATAGSVGLDLRAVLSTHRTIESGQRWKFDTGISIQPVSPHRSLARYGALVQPRSGLALHHGVVAITGVIDSDYRGRIGVLLLNTGHQPYVVNPGDRIAQLILVELPRFEIAEVDVLDDTDRGSAGWGSTGRS